MISKMKKILLTAMCLLLIGLKVNAQENTLDPITTSLPFLLVSTDAKAGGMADIGVATASDAHALFHNPSKIAFNKSQLSIGVNYVPWLRNLTDDIFVGSLSAINRINENSAFGVDMKYFSLGEIQLTSNTGVDQGTRNPSEFALAGYYSLKLSETYSMGIGLRYINSNLDVNDQFDAVNTLAVDISGYYQSPEANFGNFNGRYRFGFNIANIGPKVEYVAGNPNFIPTILKLGGGFDFILDSFNVVGINTEFRKLLVPADANSESGFVSGIFESFGDSNELQEIGVSIGANYTYNDAFGIRAGYFTESEEQGNRKFLTLGAGFKAKAFTVDLSYLLNTSDVNNPLENTLRFSLAFDLGQIYEDY